MYQLTTTNGPSPRCAKIRNNFNCNSTAILSGNSHLLNFSTDDNFDECLSISNKSPEFKYNLTPQKEVKNYNFQQ
ncbi:unnamed protein product [Schistosoma margrebowiei]|uniref:Uncharacterized protein n=1 Tax=Schistosoma margrebowiei TaxID=48269 RepID=A0A183M836_9TREM|nr:unnamed protein product [Schistosoma margrebowiei]